MSKLNLQKEFEANLENGGLRLELSRAISFGSAGGYFWSITISRRRVSDKTGNEVKPEKIVTLLADKGEEFPAFLKRVAEMWAEDVEDPRS